MPVKQGIAAKRPRHRVHSEPFRSDYSRLAMVRLYPPPTAGETAPGESVSCLIQQPEVVEYHSGVAAENALAIFINRDAVGNASHLISAGKMVNLGFPAHSCEEINIIKPQLRRSV